MKKTNKKNKIIKIITTSLFALSLFFLPMSSITLNASTNDYYDNESGIAYTLSNQIRELNFDEAVIIDGWLEPNFIKTASAEAFDTSSVFKFYYSYLNGFNAGHSYIYLDYQVYFDQQAGFSTAGVNQFFNAFDIYVNDSANYTISLCNYVITGTNTGVANNQYLIYEFSNGQILTNTIFKFTSGNVQQHELQVTGNINSVGNVWSWFYNYLYCGIDEYILNNYWASGNYATTRFVDLKSIADYFSIDYNLIVLMDFDGNYCYFDYDTLSIYNEDVNIYYVYKNYINQYYIEGLEVLDGTYTFNEISFIYNLFYIHQYPTADINATITNLPDYFTFNTSELWKFVNNDYPTIAYYMPIIDIYDRNYIGFAWDSIYLYLIENNGSNVNYVRIKNLHAGTYFNDYDVDTFVFTFGVGAASSLDRYGYVDLNHLNYLIVKKSGFPSVISGWYTFDLQPNKNSNNFAFEVDISFTSNSQGYNMLYISSYKNIMGTDGTAIYYGVKDEHGVIDYTLVYEYSSVPLKDKWLSVNYRQIFFDKTLVPAEIIDDLESMGTFTFISNRVDNDFTLRDVFWSIAEVPVITLRKTFDFELLGTSATSFVIGIITASVILYVLRRIF